MLLLSALLLAAGHSAPAPIPVLVFEKRLPASVEPYGAVDSMFQRLAPGLNLSLRFTRDSNMIHPDSLRPYRILVWNNVMRNVLSGAQQQAFRDWMEGGGGWIGFHAAATNRRIWPWYVDGFLGGDNFAQDHIAWGETTIHSDTVARPGRDLGVTHPIMAGVPRSLGHYGEWYRWNPDPAANPAITVLQWYRPKRIDPAWPEALPVSWCRDVGKGRLFYTQASHEASLYREAWYQAMVANAVRWVAEERTSGIAGTRGAGAVRPTPYSFPTPRWPLPGGGNADARGTLLP